MKCVVCSKPFSLAGNCHRGDCPKGNLETRETRFRRAFNPITGGDTGRTREGHDPLSLPFVMAALALIIAVIALIAANTQARALDHGFSLVRPQTDTMKWFESLKVPDNPPANCCGKGDAYEADVYDIEGYDKGRKMCSATITDGSAKEWPDGTRRIKVPNGTVVEFPCSKVNPPKDGNPTGHAQIFLSVQGQYDDTGSLADTGKVNSAYCFVPLPPGM